MIAVSAFCVISAIKAEGVKPVKNDLIMTNQHEALIKKEIKAQRLENVKMEGAKYPMDKQQFYEDS